MAPTSRITPRELNILLTGFGPFMGVGNNPSWLAVRPLHDTLLDLDTAPLLTPGSTVQERREERADGVVRARIQTLQLPVNYGSVLDVVPRIHGAEAPASPQAKFWHDSRLDPQFGGKEGGKYPEAYPVEPPAVGTWDVVIHVGVGRNGSLRCETQAHKYGYGKPDAQSEYAPLVTHERPNIIPKYLDKDNRVRGFAAGYEQFDELESTPVHVSELVAWLKERGAREDEVDQSFDPGRYVCDFILYCSLCEAKRSNTGAKVLFVHVPPAGQSLEVERCTEVIRAVAWWIARRKAGEEGLM